MRDDEGAPLTLRVEHACNSRREYGRRVTREVAIVRDITSDGSDAAAQAQLWANAFGELGFAIRHLGIDPAAAVDAPTLEPTLERTLESGLEGCALALAANVCSVPTHPHVSTVATALGAYASHGGRVIFHHHDLPWDPGVVARDDMTLPPRIAGAVHIGSSLRARRDLHAHGYAPALAVHDHFDFDAPTGAREGTRAALGFAPDEIVLYQPTRATRNTNVAGAVRFVTALHGAIPKQTLRYWLRGPVADDVAPTVARLLDRCPVPVTIGDDADRRDTFAASDVVLLPSTWDPTGASAVESIIADRPCVVGQFPVLGELHAVGLRFFAIGEPVELVKFLSRPDTRLADVNLRRARLSFSAEHLPSKLADVLMSMELDT